MLEVLVQEWGGIVLGRLSEDADGIPEGCVVSVDADGTEWLVFAPRVVGQMRAECPICSAGGEHDHEA